MKSVFISLWAALFVLGLAASFHGCSSEQVATEDPAVLYKDAEDEISSDHFLVALEKLKAIKNKYPYSKYATDAQLRIADVYYLQESYPEAAAAYETFRDLHPKHEKVPYAMFRIAKSYYADMPDPISRDMTPANKALDAYNDFLRRFPTAPEAVEAKKDVDQIRELLAEKELYIGNFYYKRDFYLSAKGRYEKIIDLYADTPSSKEAKEKLAKIDAMSIPSPRESKQEKTTE